MWVRFVTGSAALAMVATGSVVAFPTVASAEVEVDSASVVSELGQAAVIQAAANATAAPEAGRVPLVTDAIVAAPAPGPSGSASPTIPPKPDDFWMLDRTRSTSNYQAFNSGTLRYANTPAAAVDADGKVVGYDFRMVSGVPGAPNSNRGSGVCMQSAEGRTITSPIPVPDICGQAISRQEMMCYLSPFNIGGPGEIAALGPYANWSWGTTWSVSMKKYLEERYTHVLRGTQWVPVRTFQTRASSVWNQNEYRYTWGDCQTPPAGPRAITYPCVTSIGPIKMRGPFGNGLPARNGYDKDSVIPQTVEKRWTVLNNNGSVWTGLTPIGQVYENRGRNLYGGGERDTRSIALVENCATQGSAALPNNETTRLEGWGNFESNQEIETIECRIIYYSTFNQKNFNGCGPERASNQIGYTVQECDPDNLAGAPLVTRNLTRPDTETNFDPESPDMNCLKAECEWTNVRTAESGLPRTQEGVNRRGTSLVWSAQDPDTLLLPRTTAAVPDPNIYVAGNGRNISIQAPRLNMTVRSPLLESTGVKWTTWQITPQSTPLRKDAGVNAKTQPFTSRALNEEGVLSMGGAEYLYAGGDPQTKFMPNGNPAFARNGQKPIVNIDANGNYRWVRTLVMNFYRPSLDTEPKWQVRGEFHEVFNVRVGISGMTSTNGFATPRSAGAGNVPTQIAKTCSTRWTDFSIVNERGTATYNLPSR